MPLRISEKYFEVGEIKKVRRKMSRNGHFTKVRRPTGLEVYNDAAKILEELLEKRIDDDIRGPHPARRNKTDPQANRIASVLEDDSTKAVARSKTMPSKYREPHKDESIKEKDLDALLRREAGRAGSESSAESDADSSEVTDNRKKKSFFKRAKERLIHTFNRDQKEGIGKIREKSDKNSPSSFERRKKKKGSSLKDPFVNETDRHIKAHMNDDKSVDYTEEVEYRNSKGSIHGEIHGVSNNGRKKSFIQNLKHSIGQRGSKSIDVSYEAQSEEYNKDGLSKTKQPDVINASLKNGSPSTPSPRDPYSQLQSSSLPHPSPSQSSTPHPVPESSSIPSASSRHRPPPTSGQGSVSLPSKSSSSSPTGSHGDQQYHSTPDKFKPGAVSSSSSVLPVSEHNSEGSSANILTPSALDSPGDDIQFIDMEVSSQGNGDGEEGQQGEGHGRSNRATGIKFHGSEGLMNFNWLADRTAAQAKELDYEIDEQSVSTLRPDGQVETTTRVTATRTVVMPDLPEDEVVDIPDGLTSTDEILAEDQAEKEAMYGKVVQKLIEMGDLYNVSMADQESTGATALPSPRPLNDLENEIIACLRAGGDRYTKQLEDKADAIKNDVKTDAYERFRSTVENSMGNEFSWNYVALLFYATKGVVSAVGKGTQSANQVKEFTLRYISDTCASWIMDQGGFDSMLSDTETDPELD